MEKMREPLVACPACDTVTTTQDLLPHVRERCPGPRDPGPASIWISLPEARRAGVSPHTLISWARRGQVEVRGEPGDRKYLLRDVAKRFSASIARDRRRNRAVAR
jgi:hypothetical protein